MHFNLTFGERTYRETTECLHCGTETILVTASSWRTHCDERHDIEEFVEDNGNVSGHYCPECGIITAVFVNTREQS